LARLDGSWDVFFSTECSTNSLENVGHLVLNFRIGKPQYQIALLFQIALPFGIVFGDIWQLMYCAIDLDYQTVFRAVEIQDKCLQGVLASKSYAFEAAQTQLFLEEGFGGSHFPTQLL
jgi:hypothetical protein